MASAATSRACSDLPRVCRPPTRVQRPPTRVQRPPTRVQRPPTRVEEPLRGNRTEETRARCTHARERPPDAVSGRRSRGRDRPTPDKTSSTAVETLPTRCEAHPSACETRCSAFETRSSADQQRCTPVESHRSAGQSVYRACRPDYRRFSVVARVVRLAERPARNDQRLKRHVHPTLTPTGRDARCPDAGKGRLHTISGRRARVRDGTARWRDNASRR
jgi:hypothetical protein